MSFEENDCFSLYQAFLAVETGEECEKFLADLCTPQEIEALKERWKICQLLAEEKLSYREIHALTGASLTTISRVGRFLKMERNYGYRCVLEKLKKKKKINNV
jgi:TrpR-related protein YerC/YecD